VGWVRAQQRTPLASQDNEGWYIRYAPSEDTGDDPLDFSPAERYPICVVQVTLSR